MGILHNRKDHLRPTKEQLHRLVVVEQKPLDMVADFHAVSRNTVKNWLKQYEIKCSLKGRPRK